MQPPPYTEEEERVRKPNRISAGTFHPDPEGRSNVTFAAAVDPAKYPVLSRGRRGRRLDS